MKVLRVETADGTGPYRDFDLDLWCHRRHYPGNGHPNIWDDFNGFDIASLIPEYICGFADRKQMEEWFSIGERARLAACGFVLSTYEVDPQYVRFGGHQVIFSEPEATCIEECDLY